MTLDTRELVSDHGMAGMMQRMILRNAVAHHRDGVPVSDNFERARKMIDPKNVSDEVASGLRHILVAHAAGKAPPADLTDDVERDYIFSKKPVETLEAELVYMEQNVDPTSFASLALLADLYMEAGYDLEARMAYEKALKVARENGGTYAE